jgi:hypothetical protein
MTQKDEALARLREALVAAQAAFVRGALLGDGQERVIQELRVAAPPGD